MQFVHGFPGSGETPRPSVFGDQFLPPSMSTADLGPDGLSRLQPPSQQWGAPPMDSSMATTIPGSWLQTTPSQMPWGINQPSLVRFTGEQSGSQLYGLPFNKRKKDPDLDVSPARKRLLTEEHMAAHMSNLRISSSYSPGVGEFQTITAQTNDSNLNEPENEEAMKRLFVCEEIKRYKNEILPSAILCKLQKPSTALMLWQPPAGVLGRPLQDSILSGQARRAAEQDEEERDNNNASAMNLNMLSAEGYRDLTSATEDMDL